MVGVKSTACMQSVFSGDAKAPLDCPKAGEASGALVLACADSMERGGRSPLRATSSFLFFLFFLFPSGFS